MGAQPSTLRTSGHRRHNHSGAPQHAIGLDRYSSRSSSVASVGRLSRSNSSRIQDSTSFTSAHFSHRVPLDSHTSVSATGSRVFSPDQARTRVTSSQYISPQSVSHPGSPEYNLSLRPLPAHFTSEPPVIHERLNSSDQYRRNSLPLQPVERFWNQRSMTSTATPGGGRPKLFYAEPFTRLDSRPSSTSSNLRLTSPNRIIAQQYNEVRSIRLIPTHPVMPNQDLINTSQFDYNYSNQSKRWRLTHIGPPGGQTKRLPRITLVKYKMEAFSNNLIKEEEEENSKYYDYKDGRRPLSPPTRSSTLATPGRRLSLISGNSTQVLKVIDATPLTPVTIAPDVTQFLFPHEVSALSNSTSSLPIIDSKDGQTFPSIDRGSNTKVDMFTQTDKVASSYAQTEDSSSTIKTSRNARLSQRAHIRSRRLSSIGENTGKTANRLPESGYLAGGRIKKRSSSLAPGFKY